MSAFLSPGDLLALVADQDMEWGLRGIVSRHKSLRIRPVAVDVRRHPHRDSGCCANGVAFLRSFASQYQHALLVFDHEGCGRTDTLAIHLEGEIEKELATAGWGDRAAVIVVEPELEAWIWSDSPHVEREMGWQGHDPSLRSWLIEENLLRPNGVKPSDPKKAFEGALRVIGKAHSPALFSSLAKKVSLTRCTDRSFAKLRDTLRKWFAEKPELGSHS